MSEIKYFSQDNASTFAEQIKRLFATKAAQQQLEKQLSKLSDDIEDNELVVAATFNKLVEKLGFDSSVEPTDLKTEDKSSIIAAINEILDKANDTSALTELAEKIGLDEDGELSNLETDDKSSLVAALNEVKQLIIDNEKVIAASLNDLNDRLGDTIDTPNIEFEDIEDTNEYEDLF